MLRKRTSRAKSIHCLGAELGGKYTSFRILGNLICSDEVNNNKNHLIEDKFANCISPLSVPPGYDLCTFDLSKTAQKRNVLVTYCPFSEILSHYIRYLVQLT